MSPANTEAEPAAPGATEELAAALAGKGTTLGM